MSSRIHAEAKSSSTPVAGFKVERSHLLHPHEVEQVESEVTSCDNENKLNTSAPPNPLPPPPSINHHFGQVSVQARRSPVIQTKLAIGQPGDKYEQEADRVADQIMRMPEPGSVAWRMTNSGQTPSIQRVCSECQDEIQRQPEDEEGEEILQTKLLANQITFLGQRQVQRTEDKDFLRLKPILGLHLDTSPKHQPHISALQGHGYPLSESERTFFEPRFGTDFSYVRLHTDRRAVETAHAINARAFTLGQNIVFGEDQYKPKSPEGRRLLAHELTHVVQQTSSRPITGLNALADYRNGAKSSEINKSPFKNNPLQIKQTASYGKPQALFGEIGEAIGDYLYEQDPLNLRTYSVASVIDEDDPTKVSRLTNEQILNATETQKIQLIQLIHRLTWVGPFDEERLELIWNSFGEGRLPEVAKQNWMLFQESIEYGAELDDIAVVESIKQRFETDIRLQAIQYLISNFALTVEEKQRLGLYTADEPLTEEQRESISEVQRAAEIVKHAQEVQNQLRQIILGYTQNRTPPPESFSQPRFIPVRFDPDRRPPSFPPNFGNPDITWEEVKEQYDRLANIINGLANRYPSVYALAREGPDSLQQTAQVTPEQARGLVGNALDTVQSKILEAFPKIGNGDIDFYDLMDKLRQVVLRGMRSFINGQLRIIYQTMKHVNFGQKLD
jgi:Domain of unknown function (DUF4157)